MVLSQQWRMEQMATVRFSAILIKSSYKTEGDSAVSAALMYNNRMI